MEHLTKDELLAVINNPKTTALDRQIAWFWLERKEN